MDGESSEGIVQLRPGRVRGRRDDGVWYFGGVPYARAPVGHLRWRPPEPPEPWSGVRSAVSAGAVAPQPPPEQGMALPGDPSEQSEDCLFVNVWTPGLDHQRRPVMVWIHGGGFTGGTGSSLLYRGDVLSGEGDVVVVTLNYRLGALGFLAHPTLADGPGRPAANWALLDQAAALRWVRDHISAFGGDPDNVTVFGESAGAMCIGSLLAMDAARGLFRRAILQSGPPFSHTAARGAEVADELLRELGMAEVDRDRLESVPAADLVEAIARLQARPSVLGDLPSPLLPVVDGTSLPVEPLRAIAAGCARDVALLTGTTRDELAFFVLADPRQAGLDEGGLLATLERAAPAVPPADVVAAYRTARQARGEPVSPRDLWVAAGTDLIFRREVLKMAAAQRAHQPATFVYLFTWESPAFGGRLGSCHALDIPFVFGSVRYPEVMQFSGGGPEADALSAAVRGAWLAFARRGDPSHPGVGEWPAWDAVRQSTMVLGPETGAVERPRSEELAVWDPMGSLVPGEGSVVGGSALPGSVGGTTPGG
ncbi:MAG: carboxylesterase/lipase family protein [Acidimicrobiales bacterium]